MPPIVAGFFGGGGSIGLKATVTAAGSFGEAAAAIAAEGSVAIAGVSAGAIAVTVAGVGATGTILQFAGNERAEENRRKAEGEAETPKNKIPNNDSATGHIFRDAEGHIPDTPENRALLEGTANDPANFRGADKYGNEWYTKTLDDGSQVWVESRNGNIFEGGINNTPKPWNSETGLKLP